MENSWMEALEMMGSGMVGIFVVMAVIALAVFVLTKIGTDRKD